MNFNQLESKYAQVGSGYHPRQFSYEQNNAATVIDLS